VPGGGQGFRPGRGGENICRFALDKNNVLMFPDFCTSHGRRNALPLEQKNIFFRVFAMKTAKPYFNIP